MTGAVPVRAGDVARSVLFAIVFYGGTVIAVTIAPLVALLGPGVVRRFCVRWLRFHGWCARVLLGIRRRVEGAAPPPRPVIYAAKHEAMYETIELAAMLGNPAVLVKSELTRIPLWGWAAKQCGVISVDRDGSAQALRELLRATSAAMAEGRSILIFPEGTRVPPGTSPPLRSGFAGLYRQLGVEVVPVALDSGRLSPRRSFVKRAGTVTFRFGDPIPAGLPRRVAEARVHAAINALNPQEAPPS